MRLIALALAALFPVSALAECIPADAEAIAAAENVMRNAEYKATQAESVAVRSGNPGAGARAKQARALASAAQEELARLTCKVPDAGPASRPKSAH